MIRANMKSSAGYCAGFATYSGTLYGVDNTMYDSGASVTLKHLTASVNVQGVITVTSDIDGTLKSGTTVVSVTAGTPATISIGSTVTAIFFA